MTRKRRIRTVAGLQRAWKASTRGSSRLYRRPYILQPALKCHLGRFEDLKTIEDDAARFQAFRRIPALEYELAAIDRSLTSEQRNTLAQRDRATRPRVRLTDDGQTLETIIFGILAQRNDPRRLRAKEYWRPLVDRLQLLELNPTVMPDPASAYGEKLEYDHDGGRRSLAPGQFENIVSRVRSRLTRVPTDRSRLS